MIMPIPNQNIHWSFILRRALARSLMKMDPIWQSKNPVMFCVYVATLFSTWLTFRAAWMPTPNETLTFTAAITFWLWITVAFANLAEALAEGQSQAHADSLRKSRTQVIATQVMEIPSPWLDPSRVLDQHSTLLDLKELPKRSMEASRLELNDYVLVQAGEIIPADGEVILGVATVDESAITGESAPVVRESGGDRNAVTGGTRVLSDWIMLKVTCLPGKSFLDRMIAMVEGAKRRKTPNEIALSIFLAALTLIFLLVVASLQPLSAFSVETTGNGRVISLVVLIALFVCLAPTTIGALLSAIGIAGINRLSRANVVALSGRAVEAAGDVDVLLLDKTGTITLGNRHASRFLPTSNCRMDELVEAAHLSSLADETAEGRSIAVLAKQQCGLRGISLEGKQAEFIPFTARTRMSGLNIQGKMIRKGAADAIAKWVDSLGKSFPEEVHAAVDSISRAGGTPLVVACDGIVLGTIELKDIVKGGIKERFAELRQMGIKTIMITGDNPITAGAIAAESGVDDFLAEATPEAKLALIREYQSTGRLVAMTGDGTNDAPALAQADVAVAMNSGTQAAKEAGNMVDLDSNPTKLVEIVNIGKQLLMTRGALTTFSIANDIAKYFAILPAAFASTYPELRALDLMHLGSPNSAILSAVIFNALIIVALIPLALRGVTYHPIGAAALLRRNLLIYGVGGLVLPFIGIKCIDLLVAPFF